MPVSFMTLAGLVIFAVLGWAGVVVPEWIRGPLMTVLVSAAIGYITNWIAIEMLFKPYEKSPFHILSILTFGIWQQGLVPRNKDKIGHELGVMTEKELMGPQMLKQHLKDCFCCAEEKRLCGACDKDSHTNRVGEAIRKALLKNEQKLIEFLSPKLKKLIVNSLSGKNSANDGSSASPISNLMGMFGGLVKNVKQAATPVVGKYFDDKFLF